jgi:hypothetical protein
MAQYMLLQDQYIGGQQPQELLAGTVQSTVDVGGVLPAGWVPNPNVDPIDIPAYVAYLAAGPRDRGLMRTQWQPYPVPKPKYNWGVFQGRPWLLPVIYLTNDAGVPLTDDSGNPLYVGM